MALFALLGYFLLTFALTWTAWLAPATPGTARLFGVGGPVFLLGVFGPAIVALALTALGEGRAGVARLLARIGKWQVGARFYLFAIGYMAATKLLAALIRRMAVGHWPTFGDTPVPLMLGAIVVSTWVQAGDELGWRGYALPRLAKYVGLGAAGVLIGVIWALWHVPLFFLQGSDSAGQSFPIYLLHVTALSVAMSWLYWKTEGSLLLVMLMRSSQGRAIPGLPSQRREGELFGRLRSRRRDSSCATSSAPALESAWDQKLGRLAALRRTRCQTWFRF